MAATVDEFGEPIPTLNDFANLDAEPTPAVPRKQKKSQPAQSGNSPGFDPEQAQDAMGYLRSISQGNAVRIMISRQAPRFWKGVAITGHLDTVSEFIEESEIKDRWGGGKYAIKVTIQDKSGKWKFAGQRTIEVSGPPNEESLQTTSMANPTAPPEDSSVIRQAMQTMANVTAEERSRNDRLIDELQTSRTADNGSSEMMRIMQENNRLMMELAEKRNVALEKQLMAAQHKEPSTQDKVIEKLLLDDQGRVNALREMHASELRQMRENSLAEMKRIEDRADRTIEDMRRSHDREIDNIKSSNQSSMDTFKAAQESKFMIMQSENRRLEQEVQELKAELKELRATKDKSPTETMMELAQLKEAMDGIMGGGEKEESSTIKQIMDAAPGVINGIVQQRQAAAVAAQAQQVQSPVPVAQQVQTPQPRVPAQVKKVVKQKAKETVEKKDDGKITLNVDPQQVAMAVTFLENAVANDTQPEELVGTIQGLLPPEILQQITAVGIDKWIDNVAQLSPGSSLGDQRGRNFIKQLAKLLRG